jgi:hypothetical protein
MVLNVAVSAALSCFLGRGAEKVRCVPWWNVASTLCTCKLDVLVPRLATTRCLLTMRSSRGNQGTVVCDGPCLKSRDQKWASGLASSVEDGAGFKVDRLHRRIAGNGEVRILILPDAQVTDSTYFVHREIWILGRRYLRFLAHSVQNELNDALLVG